MGKSEGWLRMGWNIIWGTTLRIIFEYLIFNLVHRKIFVNSEYLYFFVDILIIRSEFVRVETENTAGCRKFSLNLVTIVANWSRFSRGFSVALKIAD